MKTTLSNETYVSATQAKLLYELGFDWDHIYGYFFHAWMDEPEFDTLDGCETESVMYDGTDIYPAPSLAQVHKWLREKNGIAINVIAHDGDFYTNEIIFLSNAKEDIYWDYKFNSNYNTYEEALSDAITKVLILISDEEWHGEDRVSTTKEKL